MAKKIKISVSTKSQPLKVTHPDTAGIDVGKTLMQVSVPEDRSEKSNRSFGTFTKDLREIVQWLTGCGINRVVMESTGVYTGSHCSLCFRKREWKPYLSMPGM